MADSETAAEKAVKEIKVSYESRKPLIHIEEALKFDDQIQQMPWRIEGGSVENAFQTAEASLSGSNFFRI